MSISHDANEILVSGTETGDALRTYMTTNALGTTYGRTAILDRNIDITQNASFTDHDCTWIFPSTYHWDFSGKADLFELEDAVIVYTESPKSHTTQPRAETIRLINVQYRIEGNTSRTDFFGGQNGFEFSNVQLISYGSGLNYLHISTEGGLMEDVAVKVGSGALAFQPSSSNNNTLTLRNWTLDQSLGLIQGNGNANNLTAVTRLENLVWGKTVWHIGTGSRGQHYKVINPIKPTGWQSYKGSTNTAKCRCDEYHTHNVRIVDEDNNALSGFAVHLRRSDGTVVYELTTDSKGDIAEQEVMTHEQTGQTGAGGADFTQYNGFSLAGVSYSNKLVSGIKNLADGRIDEVIGSFTDATIIDTKATANAYTEINTPEKFYDRAKAHLVDNFAGETATIVSREGNSIDAGSYDVVIDATASSVFAISSNTLTIKATTFVGNISTTGTTTLSNGAEVIGTFGATTVLPWEIKNIEATSRLQLYNVTKDAVVVTQKLTGIAYNKAILLELHGHIYAVTLKHDGAFIDATSLEVIASGSASSSWTLQSGVVQFNVGSGVLGSALTQDDADINVDLIQGHEDNTVTATATINSSEFDDEPIANNNGNIDVSGSYNASEIAVNDIIRLRVTCVVGAAAMLPVEIAGVATSTGITFSVDQVADEVYNANGINGSTVEKTESNSSGTLVADYASPMGVDVSDADGTASVKEIYAFFVYSTTTEDGVDKWFGGMRAIDNANYEVVTANADIKIQNIGTNAVIVSDGRLFRDDSTSVLYAEDGDKPISMDSGALVTSVQPQVEAALNSNAKISSTNNNSKLIPSLL